MSETRETFSRSQVSCPEDTGENSTHEMKMERKMCERAVSMPERAPRPARVKPSSRGLGRTLGVSGRVSGPAGGRENAGVPFLPERPEAPSLAAVPANEGLLSGSQLPSHLGQQGCKGGCFQWITEGSIWPCFVLAQENCLRAEHTHNP